MHLVTFQTLARERVDALYISADPIFYSYRTGPRISPEGRGEWQVRRSRFAGPTVLASTDDEP